MTLKRIPANLVEWFWRSVEGVLGSGGEKALAVRVAKAETIVCVYYVYLMAVSYGRIGAASGALNRPVQPGLDLALTSWIPLESWRPLAVGFAMLMLAASLVAATIPRWRTPRVLAIVSFLLLEAMKFDLDGKISHAFFPLVWTGIAFCFLPGLRNDSNERRRSYLASFFGAQVLVCLLFTCAGISKLVGIVLDWGSGVTWLHPEALALTLSAHWPAGTPTDPQRVPIRAFFVLNPWAAWLSNLGVLYVEITALSAVFRPRLHRLWALGLLIMLAMVWLTMGVQFLQSAFGVGLILLASPFAPDTLELKKTLLDLPMVRFVHQWFRARRGAGADGESGRRSSRVRPWAPTSMVMRLWIPVAVAIYLGVAFGNLDRHGGFEPGSRQRRSRPGGEVYPISAMPMFMRIDGGEQNTRKLARIRRQLERARNGTVDDRRKQEKGRKARPTAG